MKGGDRNEVAQNQREVFSKTGPQGAEALA